MKLRIDQLVYQNGFAESREKAKRLIMAGSVYINDLIIDKPGTNVDSESIITIKGKKIKYVSRGGLKLEKAIINYGIDLKNKVCMDIGASTGGFTDCMLQNGAEKVFSIDVGYGQLDYKLRINPNVINLEKTNFRYLKFEQISEKIDFFTIDVSFISLDKIIPVLTQFTKEKAQLVALIKPQFEAGRENVKKKGVVKDFKIHEDVLNKIAMLLFENKWDIVDLTYSPIKGPKGNIEFLAFCTKEEEEIKLLGKDIIKSIVNISHKKLL